MRFLIAISKSFVNPRLLVYPDLILDLNSQHHIGYFCTSTLILNCIHTTVHSSGITLASSLSRHHRSVSRASLTPSVSVHRLLRLVPLVRHLFPRSCWSSLTDPHRAPSRRPGHPDVGHYHATRHHCAFALPAPPSCCGHAIVVNPLRLSIKGASPSVLTTLIRLLLSRTTPPLSFPFISLFGSPVAHLRRLLNSATSKLLPRLLREAT
jgi:hypothetical protein